MSYRTSSLCAAMGCAALAMTIQVPARAGTFHFTVLNDPLAISPSNGTAGNQINAHGVVAGIYQGANGVYYGFVSNPPYSTTGYTTVEGPPGSLDNNLLGINPEGVVTGFTEDSNNVFHGMVSLPPYSVVTTFDAPGACVDAVPACIGGYAGTSPWNINLEGVIAGTYVDVNGLNHGFVGRPPYNKSDFTTLDAPGSSSGTSVLWNSLTDLGAVTGYYLDANLVGHGFVTHPPYGKTDFTTFDAPGACSSGSACTYSGTYPESINLEGMITGTYFDVYGVGHGFVSYPPYTKRTFISFDAPGACSSDSNPACYVLVGTVPEAINWEGVITGYFVDANNVNHGFVTYPPYITVETFDVPGACSFGSACSGSGTAAFAINPEGQITGQYVDASGTRHGFIAQQR